MSYTPFERLFEFEYLSLKKIEEFYLFITVDSRLIG